MWCKKGSASVESVIIVAVLLVFILMPLMAVALEKIILLFSIKNIVDTTEAVLYSATTEMEIGNLSRGIIAYDIASLQSKVEEALEKKYGQVMVIELTEFHYYPFANGFLPCSPGNHIQYDTLHVRLRMTYLKPIFAGTFESGDERLVEFHFDLEMPQNN